MQVLKEEVRNAILRKARKEFRTYGYRDSSLRRIADNTGISAGNLYRYFKGKDDLFGSIVRPALDCIKEILNHEVIEMGSIEKKRFDDMVDIEIPSVITAFITYREELLLVLKQSEGSSYESEKRNMISYFIGHIHEHLDADRINSGNDSIRYIPEAYAVSVLEGLLSILEKNDDDEILCGNLTVYLDFEVNNFISLIFKLRKI